MMIGNDVNSGDSFQGKQGGPDAYHPEEQTSAQAKWGSSVDRGFQIVPNVMIMKFNHLGISPTDFLVLLNITSFWWAPGRQPYPRVATIAKRMGTSTRTVQRSLVNLDSAGLIVMKHTSVDGVRRRAYDLAPLAKVASRLAMIGPGGGPPRKVTRLPPGMTKKRRTGTEQPCRHPDPTHFREWVGPDDD